MRYIGDIESESHDGNQLEIIGFKKFIYLLTVNMESGKKVVDQGLKHSMSMISQTLNNKQSCNLPFLV